MVLFIEVNPLRGDRWSQVININCGPERSSYKAFLLLINISSPTGTLLHSNSEIDVSHFLDKMRNVSLGEADIESETRNND